MWSVWRVAWKFQHQRRCGVTDRSPVPAASSADQTGTAVLPGDDELPSLGRRPRWDFHWELLAFLELLGVCGLAIAQPLLEVTGHSPDWFLFNSASTSDVVLFLIGATLAVPVALWALGAATGIASRRVREVAHAVLVTGVFVVLAIVVGKDVTALRGPRLAVLAVAAGGALAAAYAKSQSLRQLLRFASVGPVLFVALFVLTSPSGAVLLHKDISSRRSAQAGAAAVKRPPIVMIVFDEFPLMSLMDGKGGIDASRYPNFARLASGSTWYRNATGASGYTPYAVPAMLTGRYPHKFAAPFYGEYPDNLFTLLSGTYDLRIQESVTLLCPPRDCPTSSHDEPPGGSTRAVLAGAAGLLRKVVSPNDSTEDPTAGFREPTAAERRTESKSKQPTTGVEKDFRFDAINESQPARFGTFIDGLRPAATPALHFLHVLLPHVPYRYLPSGTRYDAPKIITLKGDAGERRPWYLELSRERYEAQLAYTDSLIGETMRTLRKSGLYDQALVVVTADHGVNFTPDVYKRDYRGSESDVLWVPLFVKEPHQTSGKVDDRNWEHADLLPTVADYARVKIPWDTDGIDQLRRTRDRSDKRFYPNPGKRVVVEGSSNFAKALRGWPPLVPTLPELVGKRVDELTVPGEGPVARVKNLHAFDDVRMGDEVPAFVYGLLPSDMPADSRIAIALNGRVGTVATVARQDASHLWFAGFLEDERLFVASANKLELFLVDPDGRHLHRVAVADLDS
jgi:sulfatase-like protein